jgi:hypothetical protein
VSLLVGLLCLVILLLITLSALKRGYKLRA